MVPATVLTQSKPVPITVVRPVSTAVPKIRVTKSKQVKPIVTMPNSPKRRHLTHIPSPKASNSPPRVTAVKAPVVNVAQGNMSYLSDFEELNGGYVSFGGSGPTWLFDIDSLTKTMNFQPVTAENQSNPSAGFQDIFDVEKAGEESDQQYVLFPVWSSCSTNPQNTDGDAAFDEKKPESKVIVSPSSSAQSKKQDDKTKREAKSKSPVNAAGTLVPTVRQISLNSTNTFSAAGPLNAAASPTHGKSSFIDASQLPDDDDMPELEDITYSNDEDHVGAEANFNNLETSITVSPIPTTRVHKDHIVTQIIGVNTPRSDEDRLELIELTVFLLPSDEKVRVEVSAVDLQVFAVRLMLLLLVHKFLLFGLTNWCCSLSAVSEGFNQIIDFLNGSSIKYALTVNPNIYVSYIKQFWITVAVKKVNNIISLQALVDKKKVVVTKAMIRDAIRLDNAEGVECLPNEEIFTELTRMGYEKPSTKLMFYKAFFSSKDAEVHGEEVNAGDAAEGDVSAANDEVPTVAEESSIPSPTPLTPPPQPSQDIPSSSQKQPIPPQSPQKVGTTQRVETSDETMIDDVSNQGSMIAEMDQDADVVLEEAKEVAKDTKEDESELAEVQEVVDVVTTAKIITEVVTAANETITAASEIITAAEAQVLDATLTAAHVRVTAAPSRRRKGVVIRDLQEESTTSTIIPAKIKSKDKGKGILVEEPKPLKKALKRLNKTPAEKAAKRQKLDEEMDYFNGMSYDDIRPIFEAKFNTNVDFLQKTKERIEEEESRALKRLNKTPAEKAAKGKKATPLTRKVPVVGYEIIEQNNKPYYKIIRADERKYLLTRFTLDQTLNAVMPSFLWPKLLTADTNYVELVDARANVHMVKMDRDYEDSAWSFSVNFYTKDGDEVDYVVTKDHQMKCVVVGRHDPRMYQPIPHKMLLNSKERLCDTAKLSAVKAIIISANESGGSFVGKVINGVVADTETKVDSAIVVKRLSFLSLVRVLTQRDICSIESLFDAFFVLQQQSCGVSSKGNEVLLKESASFLEEVIPTPPAAKTKGSSV
nr:hypothetical protein [Tanacetum cinerariifolium]